jgi:hypothetical protein
LIFLKAYSGRNDPDRTSSGVRVQLAGKSASEIPDLCRSAVARISIGFSKSDRPERAASSASREAFS